MIAQSTVRADSRLAGAAAVLAPARASLRPPPWYLSLKAAVDFALALVLLIVASPLILLAMLLVKLTSRGPALYSQTRLGKDGAPFTIYKIRTMCQHAETATGARWCLPGDNRVTRLGRILRKLHVDELPQLWNVLCGHMSLIGPRPERPEFVPQLEQAIRHYRARLQVRPGLTGLAQVQLPPDTDLASVRLKLAYDLYYIRRIGPWLDVRIMAGTALHVLGIPFRAIRALCGLARSEAIQSYYQEIADGRALIAHRQEDQPPTAIQTPQPEIRSPQSAI
jgi:lipopolysaccharide/colanic/teichoic acid biosynthesis glycosyltransferase